MLWSTFKCLIVYVILQMSFDNHLYVSMFYFFMFWLSCGNQIIWIDLNWIISPWSYISLCTAHDQGLNDKRNLPPLRTMLVLMNMANYMDSLPIEGSTAWGNLVPLFDTFFRKLVTSMPENVSWEIHTPNRITLNEATMIKVLIATQLIYDPDWIILSSGIVRGGDTPIKTTFL